MNKIAKSSTSEYLSKDILEEDFLKVFSYFNIAQRFLGSSRVDARDCFVSPPTVTQKFYTVICCILFSFSSYVFISFYIIRYNESSYVGLLLQIGVSIEIFTFLCNMIHVRFLNNEANVKFYLNMQEIDRIMGIGVHKVINKFLRLAYNAAILLFGAGICILVLMFLNLGLLLFGYIGILYLYCTITLETVHCISLSAYFVYRIRYINSILINYMEPVEFVGKVTRMNVRKRWLIRQLAAQTHDFRTSDVDIHLKALFECFEQFQNLYRFQVLLSLINYIARIIISVEYVTKGVQYNVIQVRDIVLAFVFIAFANFQAAVLCFRMEVIFREVKETKRLSIRIMSMDFDGPIRHKAKKMLKIIEESTPRFKVYDIFEINAESMLTLTGFVSIVVVTLLQFAIL